MARSRPFHASLRGRSGRADARGRRSAPTPLRITLIAVLSAVLVAAAGASGGFWMCVPGVMLAASLAETAAGAVYCAAPVVLVSLLLAESKQGAMPPLWQALVVVGLSVAVMHSVRRRLGHERDVMERAALSDPLTGLANRRMLMSMADYEIARHQRTDARFVVVMLDLDGFKQVNDRYGHAAGDQLLREVAEGLTQELRSQDTVARLGGDEFCVIAPETDNPRALAEKVTNAVANVTDGHESLSASVGLSVFPDDGVAIEKLMRTADERLLAAKRRRYERPQRRVAA
jgi:diguanylate cyclase (GGDEF)-like protein